MVMQGPSNNTDEYRYGYNGKEKDNEIKGSANQLDYGFRIYDPRIARFLSVDPLTKDYPSWSPYPFAMNRVIDGVDLDGLEYLSSEASRIKITLGKKEEIEYSEQIVANLGGSKGESLQMPYFIVPDESLPSIRELLKDVKRINRGEQSVLIPSLIPVNSEAPAKKN